MMRSDENDEIGWTDEIDEKKEKKLKNGIK